MASKFDDIKDRLTIGSKLLERRDREAQSRTQEEVRELTKLRAAQQGIQQGRSRIQSLMDEMNEISSDNRAFVDDKQSELEYLAKQEEATNNQIKSLERQIQTASRNINKSTAGRGQRAQNVFVGGVTSALSGRQVTSNISQMQQAPSMFIGALGAARGSTATQLEQRIHEDRVKLEQQRSGILEMSQNVSGREDEFVGGMASHAETQRRLAQNQAALGIHRREGTDIRGRYQSAQDFSSRVQKDQGNVSGNLGRIGDEFLSTLSRFNAALDEGADNVEELGEKLGQLEDQYTQQRRNDRDGGGGVSGRWRQGQGTIIGDAGRIVQAGGQIYRENYITSEMQQTQARIGMAKLANTRFDDVYGAATGDARSIRRVITDAFGEQIRAGEQFGDRTDTANLLELAGKTGQTIDKVGAGFMSNLDSSSIAKGFAVSPITGLASTAMVGAKAIVGGAANAAPDIVETNRMLADYRKDISRSLNYLQRAGQIGELQDEISKIDDRTVGAALGYGRGIVSAGRGLGGRRAGLVGGMRADTPTFNKMRDIGLSTDEMTSLFGAGVGVLGGEFRGEADISRAGTLRRSGRLASAEQYFQARGQLTGVGGGASDFESIMAKAVATGMDSSKNIMEMVSATSQLSGRSTQLGAVSVGGVSAAVGLASANLGTMGVDPNMRGPGIQSGINQADTAAGSRGGLTIGDIIEASKLRKAFPKAGLPARMAMERLTVTQAAAIAKNPALASQYGLGSVITNSADAKQLLNIARENATINTLGYMLDLPKLRSIVKKQESGEDLTPEERDFQLQVGVIRGFAGGGFAGATGSVFPGTNIVGPPAPDEQDASADPATGDASGLGNPLRYMDKTSGFGSRRSPGGIGSKDHKGIDLRAAVGTSIFATSNMHIDKAESDSKSGKYIRGSGTGKNKNLRFSFAHLSNWAVRPGQNVKKGDLIGYTGNTGASTGPHLHYGVFNKDTGKWENPETFMPAGGEEGEKFRSRTGSAAVMTDTPAREDSYESRFRTEDRNAFQRHFSPKSATPIRSSDEDWINKIESMNANAAIASANLVKAGEKAVKALGGYDAILTATTVSATSVEKAGENFAEAVKKAAKNLKIPDSFSEDVDALSRTVKDLDGSLEKFMLKIGQL